MTTEAKQRSKAKQDELRERFLASGQAAPVIRGRTALVDSTLLEAYSQTLGTALPDGMTLLSVGGYGRRELFPFSDVDLVLLVRKAPENGSKDALSEFLRILWDVGFRVSQSVRTVDECCTIHEGNFELTVSLLDHRFLAGDPVLFGQFRDRFARFLQSERRDMNRRLCRMARSRHAKFHQTIYRLEPDIKEHPGGMRDLQTVRWLRSLRDVTGDAGVDVHAQEFLNTVRCFLHFRAGRDQNQLAFDAQDDLAHAPFSPWQEPAECMEAFFRNASILWKTISQELEINESQDRSLLANFRDWRSRLSNSDFTVSRDRLFLRNPHDLPAFPDLVLRLFLFSARHGVPLALETERRLTENLPQISQYFQTQNLTSFWRDLFGMPHYVAALRGMQDTGFLMTLIPEWQKIQHRVTRDFYHQYTVDEHTLVTIEVLANLAETKEPARLRYVDLLNDSKDQYWLLCLALLLHDIGKGSGKEHSAESVRLAEAILERMGLQPEEAEIVKFLVAHHLDLSSLMQSRDLSDPVTAQQAGAKVRTVERLRLLTLMTYADISGVNPSAMSPWRMEQLWRLYRVTARELNRGLTTEKIDAPPLEAYGEVSPTMREFLEGLPSRYVWTHSAKQAESHCQLYQRAREGGMALEIVRKDGVYHLSVAAPDRPFLFASICGGLAGFGLNILKAEAFSNKQGYIIDSFSYSDPARALELNPPELERLRVVLGRITAGEIRAEDLLKHRPKRTAPTKASAIQSAVTCDDSASSLATAYEVITQDRPGLLYDLSTAISRAQCNIEVVLVDTEAHKAIDVFHVTHNGGKLNEEAREQLRLALLAACAN